MGLAILGWFRDGHSIPGIFAMGPLPSWDVRMLGMVSYFRHPEITRDSLHRTTTTFNFKVHKLGPVCEICEIYAPQKYPLHSIIIIYDNILLIVRTNQI